MDMSIENLDVPKLIFAGYASKCGQLSHKGPLMDNT